MDSIVLFYALHPCYLLKISQLDLRFCIISFNNESNFNVSEKTKLINNIYKLHLEDINQTCPKNAIRQSDLKNKCYLQLMGK